MLLQAALLNADADAMYSSARWLPRLSLSCTDNNTTSSEVLSSNLACKPGQQQHDLMEIAIPAPVEHAAPSQSS